ncbi:MAG TPA: MarR family transcriptional regulator [Candidatus Binatia bacterium]|nr:MarR family transcriptional regulator [Candidatus Binatia bacterium]
MGAHALKRSDVRAVLDALRRIVQGLRVSARAAERLHGISGAQLFVLQQLSEDGPHSVGSLAAQTFTHQSSVSVVVGRLAKGGFVQRLPGRADARRTEVTLTARGRALLRRAPEAAQVRLINGLQRLAPRQRRAIATGLAALVRAMDLHGDSPALFFEEGARPAARAKRRR